MASRKSDKKPAAIATKESSVVTAESDDIGGAIKQLDVLVGEMLALEVSYNGMVKNVSPNYEKSAVNLLHYLAVRQHDVRELQETLSTYGLSSLGRSEAHVMATVNSVLKALEYLGDGHEGSQMREAPVSFEAGRALLDEHTSDLLGPVAVRRSTRIMVTMPTEAATDYELVRNLLESGMDCVRINCAYDEPAVWEKMIANLRKAEQNVGKACKVFMDLAGHKLRTGEIESESPSLRWGPRKNHHGKKIGPAVVFLTPDDQVTAPPVPVDATVPLPPDWLAGVATGDFIDFEDSRGKSRQIEVIASIGNCRIGEAAKSAYISEETVFEHRPAAEGSTIGAGCTRLRRIPARERVIVLNKGDNLVLTGDGSPGSPRLVDPTGRVVRPASISVTLPEILDRVQPGDRIWIDDGKIGGIIRSVNDDQLHVEIAYVRPKGEKLRSGKGINLPDSDLQLPPLTQKDVEDLRFIASHADAVCFSFVSRARDVHALQALLHDYGGSHLGVVLKIETLEAFEHLPELLLAAMRSPMAGVMIARGDLAVECGYERMAEVQEEILWFCEAAHVPVIWATQVLEKLAKKGLPSRAEITDAAMGVRAECVMLNKGPYILEAVGTLDDILERMQDHQRKKNSMLRKLKLAQNLQMS